MSRWSVRFVGGSMYATCSYCRREARSKIEMETCPAGCQQRERRDAEKARKAAKRTEAGRLF